MKFRHMLVILKVNLIIPTEIERLSNNEGSMRLLVSLRKA